MGRFTLALTFTLALVFALALAPALAHSYTPTRAKNGFAVRWQNGAKYNLAGNPTNRSGISDAQFFDAVVRGLQRWKTAAAAGVDFDYWQGRAAEAYSPNSEYNGYSNIYFASNANGYTGLASNVIGLTQVWYNTSTGEIFEADVVLNDVNYRFTTQPADTTGFGNSKNSGGQNVYIENVITHELGHVFGLSHSGGLQSTMLFMESPEQARLGCDDQIAMHALYPSADAPKRGVIAGKIFSPINGAPVYGAHVLAISRKRGVVLATALSGSDGGYSIDALEPGDYYLAVEPFYAGAAALSAYYAGLNAKICNGRLFSRTTALAPDGVTPKTVTVSPGAVAQASPIFVMCATSTSTSTSAARSAEMKTLYTGAQNGGFGIVENFATANASGSGAIYYRLQNVSGRIEAHALAYSLYSPVHAEVSLLDQAGLPVHIEQREVVYRGASGFVNYDSYVLAKDLPQGDYYVRVSGSELSVMAYPAGGVALDAKPFFMITGTVNDGAEPALISTLPANARCAMDENFGTYVSPPGEPRRSNQQTSDDDDSGVGFCGNVTTGSSGTHNGSGAGAIIGWFLPFALALICRKVIAT